MASFPEENHDLFNQGNSTGSGLFGDVASEGQCSAFLDGIGQGCFDFSPGSPFDPDGQAVDASGVSVDAYAYF